MVQFQSLSGFQVRCNLKVVVLVNAKIQSFNPYRVFKFVATSGFPDALTGNLKVSIPIGFSSSLQPRLKELEDELVKGFNPYRVFKFVATIRIRAAAAFLIKVSIPIGFSSSLQLQRSRTAWSRS